MPVFVVLIYRGMKGATFYLLTEINDQEEDDNAEFREQEHPGDVS